MWIRLNHGANMADDSLQDLFLAPHNIRANPRQWALDWVIGYWRRLHQRSGFFKALFEFEWMKKLWRHTNLFDHCVNVLVLWIWNSLTRMNEYVCMYGEVGRSWGVKRPNMNHWISEISNDLCMPNCKFWIKRWAVPSIFLHLFEFFDNSERFLFQIISGRSLLKWTTVWPFEINESNDHQYFEANGLCPKPDNETGVRRREF